MAKELSQPSPGKKVTRRPPAPPRDVREGVHTQVTEGNVPEMHVDGISPVRRANDGLHMVHEHPVITRDQPLPPVQRPVKIPARKAELDLKGWDQTTGERFVSVAGGDSRLEANAIQSGKQFQIQYNEYYGPEAAEHFDGTQKSLDSVEGFNNYS